MSGFFQWFSQFIAHLKVWIVIAPWDAGVRIRLGRNATTLRPGLHLRLPFVDEITLVNTRLRVIAVPSVNTGRIERTCRIVRANVGVRVLDPLKAMLDCSSFESAISARMQEVIASYAGDLNADECRQHMAELFSPEVIKIEFVSFTENVVARAVRLVGDGWCMGTRDTDEGRPARY